MENTIKAIINVKSKKKKKLENLSQALLIQNAKEQKKTMTVNCDV